MRRASAAVLLLVSAALAADKTPFECRLPFPEKKAYPVWQGNDEGPTHNDEWNRYAWDFSMPEGSQVCAAADGKVEFIKEDTEGPTGKYFDNNVVVLRHADGILTEYAHLKKDGALVAVGDRVIAGDVIGLSGNTGNSTAPHLHFHCRSGDRGGPSSPSRFVDVEGGGIPKKGQTVTSGNVAVRFTPAWRALEDAVSLLDTCETMRCDGLVLPQFEAACAAAGKVKHPSVDAQAKRAARKRESRKEAHAAAAERLAAAREAKDLPVLADLATFGPADYADAPEFAKQCAALAKEFGADPGWKPAIAGLAARTQFRKLVAAALKAQTDATAKFLASKPAYDAKPDYRAAITAWEAAKEKAPDEAAADAIAEQLVGLDPAR